jgi:hypothetical protein
MFAVFDRGSHHPRALACSWQRQAFRGIASTTSLGCLPSLVCKPTRIGASGWERRSGVRAAAIHVPVDERHVFLADKAPEPGLWPALAGQGGGLRAEQISYRDGTSRGLAITIPRRHLLMPEIPTLAEAGLEGFDVTTWNLLLGARDLAAPMLARLNEAA